MDTSTKLPSFPSLICDHDLPPQPQALAISLEDLPLAQAALERWGNLLHSADSLTWPIPLPDDLIDGLAAETARLADPAGPSPALIARRANDACAHILRRATLALAGERQLRNDKISAIQQQVAEATKRRDDWIKETERTRHQAVSEPQRLLDSLLQWRPDVALDKPNLKLSVCGGIIVYGCLCALAVYIAYSQLDSSLPKHAHPVDNDVIGAIAQAGFVLFAALPPIVHYTLWRNRNIEAMRRRIDSIEAERERIVTLATTAHERELATIQQELPQLEREVASIDGALHHIVARPVQAAGPAQAAQPAGLDTLTVAQVGAAGQVVKAPEAGAPASDRETPAASATFERIRALHPAYQEAHWKTIHNALTTWHGEVRSAYSKTNYPRHVIYCNLDAAYSLDQVIAAVNRIRKAHCEADYKSSDSRKSEPTIRAILHSNFNLHEPVRHQSSHSRTIRQTSTVPGEARLTSGKVIAVAREQSKELKLPELEMVMETLPDGTLRPQRKPNGAQELVLRSKVTAMLLPEDDQQKTNAEREVIRQTLSAEVCLIPDASDLHGYISQLTEAYPQYEVHYHFLDLRGDPAFTTPVRTIPSLPTLSY